MPDSSHIAWVGKFEGGSASAMYVRATQQGDRRQLTDKLQEQTGIDWK